MVKDEGIYLREFDQVQISSDNIRLTIRWKYLSKTINELIIYEGNKTIKMKF